MISFLKRTLLLYVLKTFADKIIAFNTQLQFDLELPEGIRVMNPFRENAAILPLSSVFYKKFYDDCGPRHLILGINPGRFGAGVTGIPFTDSKRLKAECGIHYEGKETHEPSSVFIYEMISAYGGVTEFYKNIYINSVFPLGFTATNKTGKEINYNYYDSPALTKAVYPYIVEHIQKQIDNIGVETDICYCFGTGKNEQFLRTLNDKHKFFRKIIALEHPRFIMQYKSKTKQAYIDKYIAAFRQADL